MLGRLSLNFARSFYRRCVQEITFHVDPLRRYCLLNWFILYPCQFDTMSVIMIFTSFVSCVHMCNDGVSLVRDDAVTTFGRLPFPFPTKICLTPLHKKFVRSMDTWKRQYSSETRMICKWYHGNRNGKVEDHRKETKRNQEAARARNIKPGKCDANKSYKYRKKKSIESQMHLGTDGTPRYHSEIPK